MSGFGGYPFNIAPFGDVSTSTNNLRQAATACRVCNGGASSNRQSMSRTRHYARTAIANNLKIAYHNWYIDQPTRVESGVGGPITFKASIEYPIGTTVTQVTWNGSTSCTLANLTNGSLSDAIQVTIPKDDPYIVRTYQTASGNSIIFQINNGSEGILDTTNNEEYRSAVSGLADQTGSAGALSGGSASTVRRFGPMLQVVPDANPAVLVLGDSRVHGASDTFTGTSGDIGQVERCIGGTTAYINLAISGHSLTVFNTSYTLQAALQPYFNNVICEFGINDIVAFGKSQAQMTALYAACKAIFPVKNFFLATLPIESTSTDSWATLANQTTSAKNAVRVLVNTDNLTRSGYAGCFDFNAIAEDAGLVGKWIVDGTAFKYTADGTHETQAMNLLYQSSNVINTALFT